MQIFSCSLPVKTTISEEMNHCNNFKFARRDSIVGLDIPLNLQIACEQVDCINERSAKLCLGFINFTGSQLQIDTFEGSNFSLYVLTFCLAANMGNFVSFVYSNTV